MRTYCGELNKEHINLSPAVAAIFHFILEQKT